MLGRIDRKQGDGIRATVARIGRSDQPLVLSTNSYVLITGITGFTFASFSGNTWTESNNNFYHCNGYTPAFNVNTDGTKLPSQQFLAVHLGTNFVKTRLTVTSDAITFTVGGTYYLSFYASPRVASGAYTAGHQMTAKVIRAVNGAVAVDVVETEIPTSTAYITNNPAWKRYEGAFTVLANAQYSVVFDTSFSGDYSSIMFTKIEIRSTPTS